VISIVLGVGHRIWLHVLLTKIETRVEKFAKHVGEKIVHGEPLTEALYQNFMEEEARVGYLAIADFKTGYRDGVTNTLSLRNGVTALEEYLKEHGTGETVNRLIKPGQGFPGQYLHVIAATFMPPQDAKDQTPVGVLKVGYVIPGYIRGLAPFGRGFFNLVVAWWILSGGVILVILLRMRSSHGHRSWTRAGSKDASNAMAKPAKDDLDWLEQEMKKKEADYIDDQGQRWKLFFNEINLEGWKVKGTWYVSEHEIVGRPWGASLVRGHTPDSSNYIFQVQAQKIAGPDGFIILFTCDKKWLSWILGGWHNDHCEVAGYTKTSNSKKIEKYQWYLLEIRVGSEWVEGHVNGELQWKLAREEITYSSPEVGFQQGLGVAVWNALARFRDFRFLAK